MAKITVVGSAMAEYEVALTKERITIGRSRHNDLVLDDPAVSGEHAAILRLDGEVLLEDLESTNGTKVNGQPVRKHFLQDGDVIELANYSLRFLFTSAGKASAKVQKGVEACRPSNIAAIQVLSGPNCGKEIALNKPLTTIGRSEEQLAVISKRAGGYFIAHVEGSAIPKINGKAVGEAEHSMAHGDVIDIAGIQMRFLLS